MDLTLTAAELEFRDELRSWLAVHHPGPVPRDEEEAFCFMAAWQRDLHAGGWAGLSWPVEYGGRGASLMEQIIFIEESARARVPPPANFQGINNCGPAIINHGTQWQKERYLAPILAADEIWCQGFSEPDAGSDLASLKTRAARVDGGWRITGQKIWTSGGHQAQMCILLARTDESAPKHKGITYFLMEMDQAEVELRRIKQIDGGSDFNEMFLDGAWASDENVVGDVNDGWRVTVTTLMHERVGMAASFSAQARANVDRLIEECRSHGILGDPSIRRRLAQLRIEVDTMRFNVMRALTSQMRSGSAGPEGSLTKWQFSEICAATAELAGEAFPELGIELESHWGHAFLRSRAYSIEAGTTEIQKNIIAERVLGLPKGQR